jgi:hypothetical protein
MHFTCKLISSSKLTAKELPYVLTPDECIGRFSRARNTNELLKSLPNALAQQLSLSATKSIATTVNAIKRELVNGRWIGVSLTPRRTQLSATQLAAFPKLKAQLDLLSSASNKVNRAGYQQITDDVVLPRSYNYVSGEPTPENKIVVEFAGQWPSNAARLMLGKTDVQLEKLTTGKPDNANSHRSLATFKELEAESKSLYIQIPCNSPHPPIKLKLSDDVQPVAKEIQMDEWDNVLVPIIPLVNSSSNPDASAKNITNGYVYIVWNNEVWRELEVDERGYFSDVDIASERGNQQPRRHVDIFISEPETGSVYSYEPFQVVQNGELVSEGVLNLSGEARVFNLVEPQVDVVIPGVEPPETYTFDTQLSPFDADKSAQRQAVGRPLPHIWLPYKIVGEPQTLFIKHSERQLNEGELTHLAAEPEKTATELVELANYSNDKAFQQNTGVVRALNTLPSDADARPKDYALLQSQLSRNVAAIHLSKPVELVFDYKGYRALDESDDYFELQQSDGDWAQRVYLRECPRSEKDSRSIRFSGWPQEVEKVTLVRGYMGHSRHKRDNQTIILSDNSLDDLLAYQANVGSDKAPS